MDEPRKKIFVKSWDQVLEISLQSHFEAASWIIHSFHKYFVKSIQIRSYFWSVFSCIRTEYEQILRISPHSVQIQENMDQK